MLFIRELKQNLKSFIICTIICAALSLYVIALTPSLGADMQKLLDMKLPSQMQLALGLNNLDFGTPLGAYGSMFSYIYLTFGIYAAVMFAGIVSKEFTEKTAEYLFSLPASRITILVTKLSVAVLYLTASVSITFLVSWAGFEGIIKTGYDIKTVLLMCTAWWLGTLFFGAMAFMLSSFYTKTKMAIGLVMGAYLLQVVISLEDQLKLIKYLSPFDWFKGNDIINEATLSVYYSFIALAAILICLVVGCKRFLNKDVLV
ncbi:MAG: ABC transporter permease subunit [Chitinophagaceae bacterium]